MVTANSQQPIVNSSQSANNIVQYLVNPMSTDILGHVSQSHEVSQAITSALLIGPLPSLL